MREDSLIDCPNCGKPELVRLISAGSGLLFKGSGFYITDYRKASYKKDAGQDSGSSSIPDPPKPSKPDKKSDS
jgi:predicted nucleic acid-binding Zn ribbon protein